MNEPLDRGFLEDTWSLIWTTAGIVSAALFGVYKLIGGYVTAKAFEEYAERRNEEQKEMRAEFNASMKRIEDRLDRLTERISVRGDWR